MAISDIPAEKNENDENVPQRGKPMSWKQGVGLFNRQKTVELELRHVAQVLDHFFFTFMIDPSVESWPRRLSQLREEFDALRKRLEL